MTMVEDRQLIDQAASLLETVFDIRPELITENNKFFLQWFKEVERCQECGMGGYDKFVVRAAKLVLGID